MVDPTWTEQCPACGYDAQVNQLGQTYGHKGATGCPYSGTGPLVRQHIYPLKFDYFPVITAAAAYIENGNAATIRYDLEQAPAAGEYISMRTADGDVFGIAKVHRDIRGTLSEVFTEVRKAKARYWYRRSSGLVEAMNGYYGEDIGPDTSVVGFIYEPHIPGCFKSGPPVFDRV